jgi:hypothetical protein
MAMVVLALAGCATASTVAPSVDVTGTWVGKWQYEYVQQGSGDIRGTFQQNGDKLTGQFNVTGPVMNHTANVTGAVSGNEVILTLPATARLSVSGNQMSGTVNGLVPARVTLTRQ